MKKALQTIVRQQFTSEGEKNKVLDDLMRARRGAKRILAILDQRIDGSPDGDDDYSELVGAIFELEDEGNNMKGITDRLAKVIN